MQAPQSADLVGEPHAVQSAPVFVTAPPDLPRALTAGVCWVPSEYVHIALVSLPLERASQRVKALPFALEPLLGTAIESVHVALGPKIGEQDYIAAAIDLALMQEWNAQVVGPALLVPDVFMLPRPPAGEWAVVEMNGRVLVRQSDGGGFATDRIAFDAFFNAAGQPVSHLLLGDLDAFPSRPSAVTLPWPARADLLDLRQGAFAEQKREDETRRTLQFQVAGALICGITLIAGADLWALSNVRDARHAALAAGFAERFPGRSPGNRLISEVQVLSSVSAGQSSGSFLGSLSTVFASLGAEAGLAVRVLNYDNAAGRLELEVEAASIDALQQATAQLKAAGMAADIGSATTIPGGAEGRLTIVSAGAAP